MGTWFSTTELPRTRVVARAGWGHVQIAIGLVVSAILLLHQDTVLQAVAVWSRSQTYSLGWVVLPTLGYLLWHNRERLSVLRPAGSASGVLLAVLCGMAWLAADLMNIAEGRQLALLASLYAIVLAALGWRAFAVLAPFLALLVFVVPTGGFLLGPLKQVTVGFIAALGMVPGIPVETQGFAVFVDAQRYVVVDDCAGLPYLLLGLFLGLTLALLSFRTWWKIVAMVMLGGALAILANGLRVISIVLIDYALGRELDLTGHAYVGWVANGLGLMVLFSVFARLPADHAGAAENAPGAASAGSARAMRMLLLACLPVGVAPTLAQAVSDLPEQVVQVALPQYLGDWRLASGQSGWQPASQGAATVDARAIYERPGERISVFVAQAGAAQAKVSGAAVDLVGDAAWMPSRQSQRSVCVEGDCLDFTHLQLVLRDTQRTRHVYSLYAVGAATTTSVLRLRLLRAWQRVRGAPASVRQIAVACDGAPGLADREVGMVLQRLILQASIANENLGSE